MVPPENDSLPPSSIVVIRRRPFGGRWRDYFMFRLSPDKLQLGSIRAMFLQPSPVAF